MSDPVWIVEMLITMASLNNEWYKIIIYIDTYLLMLKAFTKHKANEECEHILKDIKFKI